MAKNNEGIIIRIFFGGKAMQSPSNILSRLLILAGLTFFTLPILPSAAPAADEDVLGLYFDEAAMQETTSRAPQPLTRTPENVTVISTAEIEAMHAHSVAEIISRAPGVMVNFTGREIMTTKQIDLLGTRRYHTLFLLDGIRINLASTGYAVPEFIPVGMIKRIEIIKGPASSAWGSSLGGVINVITKTANTGASPSGNGNITYGEADTRGIDGDLSLTKENVSAYLFGGHTASDGLKDDRYAERNSGLGKINIDFGQDASLNLLAGASKPVFKNGNLINIWGGFDLADEHTNESLWGSAVFTTKINNAFTLNLSLQRFNSDWTSNMTSLGTGFGGPLGTPVYLQNYDEETVTLAGQISYNSEQFTSNIGFESSRNEMKWFDIWMGGLTQYTPLKNERRGLYANAAYHQGPLSFSAGLRHDHHSTSKDLLSPSFGATYSLSEDTLLRATIARGFSAPYLLNMSITPGLKTETVWAYQTGIETHRLKVLSLKMHLFHYDIDDAWDTNDTNSGKARWDGFELAATSQSYRGFTLSGNFTYASEDSAFSGTFINNDKTYAANIIADYLHQESGLHLELAGNYIWLNEDMGNFTNRHDSDDMLWDLTISKTFLCRAGQAEAFVKARNIFSGNQYWDHDYANPKRWVEAGLSFAF